MKVIAVSTWFGGLIGLVVPSFYVLVGAALGFVLGMIICLGSDPKR